MSLSIAIAESNVSNVNCIVSVAKINFIFKNNLK